jgi:hypothetical protein
MFSSSLRRVRTVLRTYLTDHRHPATDVLGAALHLKLWCFHVVELFWRYARVWQLATLLSQVLILYQVRGLCVRSNTCQLQLAKDD